MTPPAGSACPLDIHVHPTLHETVTSIGGHYELTAERKVIVGGRSLVYLVGVAELDSSCCGVTGCAYALVAGYLVEENIGSDDYGRMCSRVERVRTDEAQHAIRKIIETRETVSQVNFR